MIMAFYPRVNESVEIDGTNYVFTSHPSALGRAYGQTGGYGTVFQVRAENAPATVNTSRPPKYYALKVFHENYREESLAVLAGQLEPFSSLPGLQVCRRTVLIPQRHANSLQRYPDLKFAMLMLWIDGLSWYDIMSAKQEMTREQSLALAHSLAYILSELERRSVAHCDLSAGNVMVRNLDGDTGLPPSVVLVDVEQLYGPGLDPPKNLPVSSPGYAHRTSDKGRWDGLADRFAGAVMLAEMVGWCDPYVRSAAWTDAYFDPIEMQQDCARYQLLLPVIEQHGGENVAYLFRRAWESNTLSDCPTFAEWLAVLSAFSAKPLRQWHWPPGVDDRVEIDGRLYTFTGYPEAPGMPYIQEGRYATVYQVRAAGMTTGPDGSQQPELGALKVFRRPLYWKGALAGLAGGQQDFASLPGLQVCSRTVLSPQRHAMVLHEHPQLLNAVLMPWIEGKTWSQVVQTKQPITQVDSVMLARSLAEILNSLSAGDVAHCDLSGENLIVPGLNAGTSPPPQVALVDVEQMYAPGLVRPDFLPKGSGGYAHRASGGLWDATADRFAGAVLLAEMMAWCDPITREAAWGDSYFAPDEVHTPCARYELLRMALIKRDESAVANLFERAWQSESLAACPTFQEWLNALPKIADSDPPEQGVDDPVESTAPGAPGSTRSSASLTARMTLLIVLLALIATCLVFWSFR